ncbi:hypothetical protein AQUCO_01300125v1 [Aquilegia coerulea]|uniref:DYW domain-containing protein n=1 Tax=Aquilegia coerulea TaxID=218851 RepID=A0A2G5E016_AQUCA|nr:hypothetical protein AQUCO_01300125v1 [Aquilegia coerulea]
MEEKCDSDAYMENLIKLYLNYGDFRSASMIFLVGFSGNRVSLSFLTEEFDKAGVRMFELLKVFGQLHRKGVVFNSRVLTLILRLCTDLIDFWFGVEIHAYIIKKGLDVDVHLKCSLMNFYGNTWGDECVDQIFDEMPKHSALLWNEVVMVNLRSGSYLKAFYLFRKMQLSGVKANEYTISKLLQACWKLETLNEGKQIHGYIIRHGLESNSVICNTLINMYTKNGKLELARTVFDLMQKPTSTSWNSMISGYAQNNFLEEAWQLFSKMELSETKPDLVTWNCLLSGHFLHRAYEKVLMIFQRMQHVSFKPNSTTITSIIQAVAELGSVNLGKEIHAYVVRNGLDYDVYVGTSLVDMYVKNGFLSGARAVFGIMKNKNIYAWNSLISGYAYNGLFEEALELLNGMEQEGIEPDLITWNGLVSGYSMWGCSEKALALIHEMRASGLNPNVVSWTALISGCSQRENYRESIQFFLQMQQEGIKPNSATLSSLIRACAGLSLLESGKEIHCTTIRSGHCEDIYVATSLIDMYCKSGSLTSAYQVFGMIKNKNVASWNSMIMGFAIHGLGKEAICLFNDMCEAGIPPDSITFTAVLSACKHSGLIDDGWKYFDSMNQDYNVIPTLEHYACMVDLLGRCGYLDEALYFIERMPLKPDASIWGALLGSCRIHKNLELAEIAAKHLFKLEPYNSANYLLMMNLYSTENRWEDVDNLKDIMSVVGVKSRPGWSWIQIDQNIHVFSGDRNPHPDIGEIYFELYQCVSEMKKLGYVPDTSCVFQNINEHDKEKVLMSHSEKLAVTFGLIKTNSDQPIRVINNIRVCSDCHTVMKYMSQISCREIVLRDGVRFHHFIDGKCSCNDYW